jgi:hypothetical protein
MIENFRIFGGELGEVEGYLDCEVHAVGSGDTIILADKNSNKQYSIDINRLEQLVNDGLAKDLSAVDTSREVWSAIESLEQTFIDSNASDKSHYIDAAKVLFRGA